MTKAEQTYERVNALVESGTKKADAFKQLAEEYGQPVDSVRGAYYGAKRQLDGGGRSSRPRRRETTPQDAIASAVATLAAAVDSIESEVDAARERAAEAQAEYEAIKAASSGRIEEIRTKIAVLDPEAGNDAPPTTEGADSDPAPTGSKPSARKGAASS